MYVGRDTVGHMLFLKVPALGNTNWHVTGHLRRGTHGKELMSPANGQRPQGYCLSPVSLEAGHHS